MTETIAKIMGIYLVLTATGFTFSRRFYERMVMGNARSDPVLLNLSGAAHLIIGLIVLVNHWHWTSPEQIIVTLVGIAATAKGAALIIVPELTLKTPKTVGTTLAISAFGFALVGLYLCYVGFMAN